MLHSMILTQSEIKVAITFRIWRNSLSRHLACFAICVIAELGLLYTLTSITLLSMLLPQGSHYGYVINELNVTRTVSHPWM